MKRGSYRKNGQSQTQYHYFFGVGSGYHGKKELTLSGKIQPDREKHRSVEEGRRQVARIVGRDTSALSAQEVRAAALETLAENLSDGVIAPLFWYLLLGVPRMVAYKMINTLDSMIRRRRR